MRHVCADKLSSQIPMMETLIRDSRVVLFPRLFHSSLAQQLKLIPPRMALAVFRSTKNNVLCTSQTHRIHILKPYVEKLQIIYHIMCDRLYLKFRKTKTSFINYCEIDSFKMTESKENWIWWKFDDDLKTIIKTLFLHLWQFSSFEVHQVFLNFWNYF